MRDQHQTHEILNSLEWWLKWPAVIGATGIAVALFGFRLNGLLSSNEYPFTWIAFQWFVAGIVFPRVLMLALRSTEKPNAMVWYERIGAVFLFGVLPSICVYALYQCLSQ